MKYSFELKKRFTRSIVKDMAVTIFPKIQDMPPEEQQIARHNLLKYCELDTYAMVKVWQELVRVSQ